MIKEQFDTTLEALKQQRDELRLQLHLLGMEARDEWRAAEQAWERMGNVLRHIRSEGAYQASEMVESFRQLADEIEKQYRRLKPMERLAEGMDDLRQMRDELRLQAHLMSMEARDRWEEAEQAWSKLGRQIEALKDKTGEALEEAAGAVRQLKDELAQRYRDIKARLKD